ncbi:MAG: FeoA domain-containing protein [candidate division WOR-3 bacterium]
MKNAKKVCNLKELKINKKVKIKKINLSSYYLKRLNLLGIKKGSKIEKMGKISSLLIFKTKKGVLVLPENLAKEVLVENE